MSESKPARCIEVRPVSEVANRSVAAGRAMVSASAAKSPPASARCAASSCARLVAVVTITAFVLRTCDTSSRSRESVCQCVCLSTDQPFDHRSIGE